MQSPKEREKKGRGKKLQRLYQERSINGKARGRYEHSLESSLTHTGGKIGAEKKGKGGEEMKSPDGRKRGEDSLPDARGGVAPG